MHDRKLISKIIEASNYIHKNTKLGNYIQVANSLDTNIHREYVDVLNKCFIVSKKDEWFLEGFEVDMDGLYYGYGENSKFNGNSATFIGLTFEDTDGITPELDSEGCPLDEFEIYDNYGNEISELTLSEYKSLLRNSKIEKIF